MTARLFDLTGRRAIVTGAGSGIGQAIALGPAQAGANLMGIGRGAMDETAALVGEVGRRFTAIHADVSDVAQVRGVLAEAVAGDEGADIPVNNAGIIRRADATDFSEDDWDTVVNTNLKSVFFLSQAFAHAALTAGRPARAVNIASLLSFQGGIRGASYTAAKSGVAGITRLMVNECAARGINVNPVVPGFVETANTQALRDDEERGAAILARIPAGRWARPSDIAGAVVFLASPAPTTCMASCSQWTADG